MTEHVVSSCPQCGEPGTFNPGANCGMCGYQMPAIDDRAEPGPAAAEPARPPLPGRRALASAHEELRGLEAERREMNLWSFVFGLPGLGLQVLPEVMGPPAARGAADGPQLLELAPIGGAVLLLIAFGFYAKYKGRSSLWALAGLLSCLGLLLMAVLKDYNAERINQLKAKIELAEGR